MLTHFQRETGFAPCWILWLTPLPLFFAMPWNTWVLMNRPSKYIHTALNCKLLECLPNNVRCSSYYVLVDDDRVTVVLVGLLVPWSVSRIVSAFISTWWAHMNDVPVLRLLLNRHVWSLLLTWPWCYLYSLQNISLSVNDLVACCGFLCGQGCNGGYPISAWRYFRRSGVVTEEVYVALVLCTTWMFWSSKSYNFFLCSNC